MTPIRLRVKELRESKGWSQSELSRRSGVRQATISVIEAGDAKGVQFRILERIATALEVDAALLVVHDRDSRPKRKGREGEQGQPLRKRQTE